MSLVYTVCFLLEVGTMAKENTPEDQGCAKEGVGSGFWDSRDGHSMNPAQFLFQSPSMFPADFMGQQQRDPLSSSLYPQFYGDVASHSGSPWNEAVDANRNDGPVLNRPVYSGFAHNNLTSGSSSLQEGSADQYIDCGRTYNLFNGAHWDLRNLTTMNDQPRYIPIGQTSVESIMKGKENEEPKVLPDTPKKENQAKPSYKEILSKSASLSKIIPQSPSSSPCQVDPVKVSPPSSRQGETGRTRLSVRNSLPPTPTHGVQKSEKKSIVDIDDEFVLSRDAATLPFGSWGLGSLETGKKKSKPSDISVTAENSVSPGRTKNVLKDLKKSSCNGSVAHPDQHTELKSSSATKRQRDVKVSNEEGSDGSSSRSELPPAHKSKPKSRETTKRRDESDKSATKSNPKSGLKKRRENDVFDNRWVKIAQDLSFKWMYGMLALTMWLVNLIVDVASLGLVASKDGVSSFMEWFRNIGKTVTTVAVLAIRHHLTRFYDLYLKRVLSFFRRKSVTEEKKKSVSNIPLPATGEEAMRRLLACKGKDPYSILGVSRSCSDEEIKRYYRKQAILVHPDKNRQAGAEEAFKILAHAFEIVGEPNRRHEYDQAEREKKLVESAEGELSDLLDALQRKMDEAVNTIKCTNCNQRHRRVKTGRPLYAGRFCGECNIYHQAKDGELWAESRWMGLKWTYLACMENTIFEITEWGNCQSGSLRHLKPNVHAVQYKLKPWSASAPNQNQEQRRNTYQDPADLSDNEWENLLAGMYKNCNFGHGPPGDRSATQKARKAKKKAK